MDNKMIGVPEIMDELGVGRPTATRLIKSYMGKFHKKNQWLRVPKDAFLNWISEGHF